MSDDAGKTFTQADLDKAAAAAAYREREKAKERYADYDDLKKAASEADKSKSQIEKLTQSIEALTTRAEKSDHELARRDVAAEFGLTPREARRLTGKTVEDLRADARDLVEDLGIDVEARKKSGPASSSKSTTEPKEGEGTEGNEGAPEGTTETQTTRTPATSRPRETLRSGAPSTAVKPEETDPLKLADLVSRR